MKVFRARWLRTMGAIAKMIRPFVSFRLFLFSFFFLYAAILTPKSYGLFDLAVIQLATESIEARQIEARQIKTDPIFRDYEFLRETMGKIGDETPEGSPSRGDANQALVVGASLTAVSTVTAAHGYHFVGGQKFALLPFKLGWVAVPREGAVGQVLRGVSKVTRYGAVGSLLFGLLRAQQAPAAGTEDSPMVQPATLAELGLTDQDLALLSAFSPEGLGPEDGLDWLIQSPEEAMAELEADPTGLGRIVSTIAARLRQGFAEGQTPPVL